MSLSPRATAQLGNLRYAEQVVEVWCHLGLLPDVGRCRVVLPAAVRFEAAPGDPAVVTLDGGDPDGPGASAVVLTGKVRGTRRSASAIEVVAADSGAELSRFRPATTYTGQDGASVVRALAGDAGADVAALDLDLALAVYVAHQRRSAAEHVALLATMGGGLALVDSDGGLLVRAFPDGQAESALKWGRELVDYQVRSWAPPDAPQVAVGFGTAGSADAPGALRPSAEPLSAGAPDPGDSAVWIPTPLLRVPRAVLSATTGMGRRQAAGATRVHADCFLLPTLRPGTVVEIQDTPDGTDAGPWLVTSVTHRLRAGSAGTTSFEGEKAEAGGGLLAGLLGAATAALGSLL